MKGGSKGKYMELVGENNEIKNITITKGDEYSMYDT